MGAIIAGILTIGIGYVLGHWDEINWKYTNPPEGYEWDARKMIIDESKGISKKGKNSKEYYRKHNSGQYFKKKEK